MEAAQIHALPDTMPILRYQSAKTVLTIATTVIKMEAVSNVMK
jgi:hypothetical protein